MNEQNIAARLVDYHHSSPSSAYYNFSEAGEQVSNLNQNNSIKLHRVLRAPADLIYRAFLDPQARCKWLPPYGYTAYIYHSDARVNGTYRMSFTNLRTGQSHAFSGRYLELNSAQRIRYTDKFEDPSMPNEMETTVDLRKVHCGTEITITQKNLPVQIPAELCYLGWQESIAQLALLVEPQVE